MKPDKVPTKEELEAWIKESGVDKLDGEDFLVNGIQQIDENTIKVTAFVNIYLKDESLFSQDIEFIAKRR